MPRPIFDLGFWRDRLDEVRRDNLPIYHSVFKHPIESWLKIEQNHKTVIGDHIGTYQGVIDCGCGYGRLLSMMPASWKGEYLGVDFSPEMVACAKNLNTHRLSIEPPRSFRVADLRNLSRAVVWDSLPAYDWAVLISVRGMVIREEGYEAWSGIEAQVKKVAEKILILEYDETDPGLVL